MYCACIDSVKYLFSDKFTISVLNALNLFEESDHKSREDCQSVASGSTRRSNSQLRSNLHLSRDEDDNDARSNRSSRHKQRVEQCSPPRSQAGASGIAQEEQVEEIS